MDTLIRMRESSDEGEELLTLEHVGTDMILNGHSDVSEIALQMKAHWTQCER